MPDDLVLLLVGSVVATRLVALWLGGARRDRGPYLALLAGDVAALAGARALGPPGATLAFVAQCAGVVLVLAPALLDAAQARVERRGDAVGRRRALRIARLRELLVPGRGATERRRALEQRGQAQSGDAGRVIGELTSALQGERDPERAAGLHVELVQVLIASGRVEEALTHAERHVGPESYEHSPALTAAVSSALGQVGRAREALRLLALLETQAAGRDLSAQPLLLPARMNYIAACGLVAETDRLLELRSIRTALSANDPARLRALAAAAASVERPDPEARVVAQELADRLLEAGTRASVPIGRRAPLTLALIVLNCAAMLAVLGLGLGHDELGLARAGALFRPAVAAGEWWRLVTAMFLHAGAFHLVANMYGLYLLGRATEELLSWPRLLIVYAVSGLGGGLASLWADRGLSVGASGAIMGLLAALTVVVFARRHHFHPAARRMLLGNLLFLGALQAFLGWEIPMIDSAAHAGGFVAGLLATAGLMPSRMLSASEKRWLGVMASAIVVLFALAAALAIRQPLAATLAKLPRHTITVGDVQVSVPTTWQREPSGLLVDRHLGIELHIEKAPDGAIRLSSPQAEDPRVRPLLESISKSARPVNGE